jgi:hypothetical protein
VTTLSWYSLPSLGSFNVPYLLVSTPAKNAANKFVSLTFSHLFNSLLPPPALGSPIGTLPHLHKMEIFCCIQLMARCPAVLLMASSFAPVKFGPFRLSTLLFFISRVLHCPFTITNIFPFCSSYFFVLLHHGWRLCLFFTRHYQLFGFVFLLVLRQ